MWGSNNIKNEKSQHNEQYSISRLIKYQRPLALGGLQRLATCSPNLLIRIPHPSLQSQGSPLRRQDFYPSLVGSERGRPMTRGDTPRWGCRHEWREQRHAPNLGREGSPSCSLLLAAPGNGPPMTTVTTSLSP